jgi:glycosyltransferase involved in cell wall biosynthesis
MMRVALVFEYNTLNGGEHSMLAALDCVHGTSFEFCAIAPPGWRLADALSTRGIEQFPWQIRDQNGVRLPRSVALDRLHRTIDAANPDLVHANSLAMGRLIGALADRLKQPTTAHLRDILRLSGAAIDDLNRNRMLLAVSQATRTAHMEQGLDARKTMVVYNGVDCDRFRPRPRTGWLKRELGLPAEAFLIANIGQIALRKGQDVLAEAAAIVSPRMPLAHYVFVGERNSAKEESVDFEQRLWATFESAGLADRLHRVGYRDDIPRILNEVDLLVHSAKQEPLGRVLLEAAASGVPILATDVGGTREILGNDILRDPERSLQDSANRSQQTLSGTETEVGCPGRHAYAGVLVPANSPLILAETMVQLYNASHLRDQLSARARQRALDRFQIEASARNLRDHWESAAAEPTPS